MKSCVCSPANRLLVRTAATHSQHCAATPCPPAVLLQDTRRFRQRWFEDVSHFSFCAPNPIVLLNICGEAPCGGMSPTDWRMVSEEGQGGGSTWQ